MEWMRDALKQWGVRVVICFLVACGDVHGDQPDAAISNPPDAAPASRSMLEVVSGGGRAQGGGFTLDVQIGHPVTQEPMTGGAVRLEGAAAVKP